MYPKLEINIDKLIHNAKEINKLLINNNITSRFLVTKVLAGEKKIVEALLDTGFTHLADSRIQNLKAFSKFNLPKVLLRIPSKSEVANTVKFADISLNSELETIKLLNKEANKQNKIHKIILMFDLGDLREGIFYKDNYLKIIEEILKLENINLYGIGTNLTCYGGVIPTPTNLGELIKIKNSIKLNLNHSLEIISGGNSSSIPLIFDKNLPADINNLRLGEIVFFGRETAYGKQLDSLYNDAFKLILQVIELKEKPSYPIGIIGLNSFGEIPDIVDKGRMKRAILAIGKQDIDLNNIFPENKNIKILDASSDHLICEVTKAKLKVGSILKFNLNYPGLLQLMTSKYITKQIKKSKS